MRGVLVDSDVLLDVITEDETGYEWSASTLSRLAETRVLNINPIVYGDVALAFARIEELEEALPRARFRRLSLPDAAVYLASRCRLDYPSVSLSSLLVGAHAAVSGLTLLTRVPGRYDCFPALDLVAPVGPGPVAEPAHLLRPRRRVRAASEVAILS